MKAPRSIILCILIALFSIGVKAQLSEGGVPYSGALVNLKSSQLLPNIALKNLDSDHLMEEDILNPVPFRYAVFVDSIIDLKVVGKTDIIRGTGRIWRLRISSGNAKSIQIIFNKFVIPQGASLFLYDDKQSRLAGAFTINNVQRDSTFTLADFKGNHINIEYFEPDNSEFEGKLIIGSIGCAYKDILSTQEISGYININCAIGRDSQLEKHAVCKMTFRSGSSSYLCSGALINNVKQDGKPYFLTANHCISDSVEASTLVTYFNYEVISCSGDTQLTKTLTGARLMSTYAPSDYTLLLLKNVPTGLYQPYYAGWDVNDQPVKKVTGIHHPQGLPKKLSVDYDSIQSNSEIISWEGKTTSPKSSHWITVFDEGITSGGSSGSPLFNSEGQIIGQLHGGDETSDFYGKLSYSYTHKPSSFPAIGDFLDPDHTGTKVLDGYSPATNTPDAFFVSQYEQVCIETPVKFSDYSVFGPYERNWIITPSGYSFVDGTSETSANPVIEFYNDTFYTVKLELAVAGVVRSSESQSIKAGNTLNIGVKSNFSDEICDCDFENMNLTASGAESYIWSIVPQDENKISINKSAGDSIVVTRLTSYTADSSYTVNMDITGTQGTCIDTVRLVYDILKPPNDNIAYAKLLKYGKSIKYNNVCGTIEEGEPVPPFTSCTSQYSWCDEYGTGTDIVENSVWFIFIANETGRVSISSAGFDNQMALYEAESYSNILTGNYTLLGANDDRTTSDYKPLINSEIVTPGKTYWIQVDGSGGGLEDEFTISLTALNATGIEDIKKERLIVFPQPSSDIVYLQSAELTQTSIELSVYEITGRCIFNGQAEVKHGEISLKVADWEPGIYIVTIYTGDSYFNARIIKN